MKSTCMYEVVVTLLKVKRTLGMDELREWKHLPATAVAKHPVSSVVLTQTLTSGVHHYELCYFWLTRVHIMLALL